MRLRDTYTKPSIPRSDTEERMYKGIDGRLGDGVGQEGRRDGNLSDLLRGNIRFFSPSATAALFLFQRNDDGQEVKYDGRREKRVECVEMMD